MDRNTLRTAPKASIQISLQLINESWACSSTCSSVTSTSVSNVSVQESAYQTFTITSATSSVPENPDIAESIASAVDRTPPITNAAFDKQNPSPLCGATIDTFVSILANEAGNLALKVMATNGVYLAGGILLHLPRTYVAARFMESFKRKGRFSELMERIPVHLILNRAALVGSAAYGLDSFKDEA